MCHAVLAVVSNCCPPLKGRFLTRYSPVRHCPLLLLDESSIRRFSFDLHVLSTPPAFVLSQDQTLRTKTYPEKNQPHHSMASQSQQKQQTQKQKTGIKTNTLSSSQTTPTHPKTATKNRNHQKRGGSNHATITNPQPQTVSKACNHPAQQQKQYPPHTKPSNQPSLQSEQHHTVKNP